MKETELETFSKLQTNLLGTTNYTLFDLCKDYHQERMKSSLPSEQEINEKLQAINKLMFDYQYKTSFNTVFDNISEEIDELIELLTKGDR